ncbi:hypothetical protein [Haloarchaeobius baliensis]|uniref:hypothetical protein n=1 Tax=Haloarchaeobius baliensis TaxID=1670458 RepID=UPI003F882A28
MTPTPHPLPLAPLQSLGLGDASPVVLAATLAVGLAALLGLVIVVRVVRRSRTDPDSSLRALAVGISLVAAAPLAFVFLDVGLLPDRLRYVAGSVVQGVGLLAVLWGMYGPAGAERRWAERSSADLVVVALALAVGTAVGVAMALVGGAGTLAAGTLAVVVTAGTFVAGQAARAYRRRADPRMLALSAGTVALVVAPNPAALVLLGRGPAHAALGYAGFLILGQALLLVTLSERGG